MRIDPVSWAVGIAGCFADWFLTRRWSKIFLGFSPLLVAVIVGGLVAWGSWSDPNDLANYYVELADAEVAAWEEQWAGTSNDSAAAKSDAVSTAQAATKTDVGDQTSPEKPPAVIPAFAEVLFRRVQQLQQNNQRSAFFVAMSYVQRGAIQQALVMLSHIAPDDRTGYAPAHAWLAGYHLSRPFTSSEEVKIAKHHADSGIGSDHISAGLLLRIAKFNADYGDVDAAVLALKEAARRDPKYNLSLAKLVGSLKPTTSRSQPTSVNPYAKHKPEGEEALKKLEAYAREQLQNNPGNVEARLLLADALLSKADFAGAEQVVTDGLQLDESPSLKTALSEIYRVKFVATSSYSPTGWSGDIELLDRAYRLDPNNPRIYEEVAKLARINDSSPHDELMDQLRKFLAEGKATSVTHAWIAERHLIKDELAEAVPHLEQVVKRDPLAARSWNNLAYCLADVYPERLEEALQCARQAVNLAKGVPDFHDTLATVLMKLGRPQDAIAAFERAIEAVAQSRGRFKPQSAYHVRVAEAYRAVGQEQMANTHMELASQIVQQATQPPPESPLTEESSPGESTESAAESASESPCSSDGESAVRPRS